MKIRVTLPLWAASTVIVGVVMMLAEGRMQQREARPVLVPGELSATRSHPRPSQLDRQSWTHRNIYLRHYHQLQLLGRPDLCCGSRVPLDPRAVVATGGFQRVASAGSIKVVEVPAQDIFPPNDVRDLIATPVDTNTLSLTWTAPGEDLDSGTASGYIVRLSEEQRNLQESHFDSAPEETLLETADSLVAAGVYQTAGTQVEVEVPVGRRLERGHLYYVALKALDNDGLSSGVSNVAQFSIPEFLAEGTAVRPHYHPAAEHNVKDPRLEDPLSASRSRETAQGREDITQLPERTHTTPSPRHADPVSEVAEGHNGWDSEDSEAVESDGPRKQEKRNGKKNRKKKKNKSKRRRKEGRRNGRRRGSERQGEGSDTSVMISLMHDINAELEKWNQS